MNKSEQYKHQQLIETLNFYRGLIIDTVEVEMCDSKAWPTTRSRLLRLLGDRGLDGKLREILGMPVKSNSESLT